MMNFEEFKTWIKENITSKDWKETSQVEISVVKKNNGISKAGLFIRENGQDVSPILYLDDYYIHYQNGEILENIIRNIRADYDEKVQMAAVKIPNLQEFENVRGEIIYRLVNYEKNKELLEDCPHRRLHDLAVTFRWVAHIDNDGVSTSLITNRQVKEWGVTISDLILTAQQNTPRLFPAKIVDIEEMLAGMRSFISCLSAIPMYILTNEQEVNGASALLYGDVLKDFANKKGTDMYILPSSIHEVILLPADRIDDPTKLLSMVHDANATVVSIGDVLSDSVYYYDRKTDHITEIVSDEILIIGGKIMDELRTTPHDFIWRVKNPQDYWADTLKEVKYDVYLNGKRRGGFIGVNRTFDDDMYYVNYYDENNNIAYCTAYTDTEIILKRVNRKE